MRREDEADLFQRLHDVADGGRRQRRREKPGQIARADRLAGREIALDDPSKDVERALIEAAERAGVLQTVVRTMLER